MKSNPYVDARAVESAIKDAAKRAAKIDSSLGVEERIRLEHFNRFLSRIFSEGDESEWVLKGGTGLLARVPSARATRDIDLYRYGFSLEQSVSDLRRLAAIDLGDHFRFVYTGHTPTLGGEDQPYTEGVSVSFDVYIGLRQQNRLQIDLATGAAITDSVSVIKPENALDLPKLVSHKYRLYPVVDQIADKVCATMQRYSGRASSRVKDLVDLVVLAVTQSIDGSALTVALATEFDRRQVDLVSHLEVPDSWGRRYPNLARSVPHCAEYLTMAEAVVLVRRMIDPALTGEVRGQRWSPSDCRWH